MAGITNVGLARWAYGYVFRGAGGMYELLVKAASGNYAHGRKIEHSGRAIADCKSSSAGPKKSRHWARRVDKFMRGWIN